MDSGPASFARRLRDMPRRRAVILGVIGTLVMALTSHAVGATRTRGGILGHLNLTNLAFGHIAGILVAVLWLGVLAFIISWAVIGGRILHHGEKLGTGTLIAWTAPFLLAGPLMSRDVYSYLMQGTLSRDGFDPYTVGASANPGPIFFEVSPDWRNTTTPYGPLHMWIGEVIVRITGDNVTAGVFVYRIFSLACFAGLVWTVAALARALGANPEVAVWLGVANPLSVIHLVGGMHNEVTMMVLVCGGLLAAVRMPVLRGALLGSILIGAGMALKATAAIALPFLVWILVARYAGPLGEDAPVRRRLRQVLADIRHGTVRRTATLVVGGAASSAVALATVAVLTVASGQSWGWVSALSGNSKVINPLAVPSLIASLLVRPIGAIDEDIFFNDILGVVRPVSTVVMVLVLVVAWVTWRRSVREAFIGATVAYMATCLFNTVVLPWYYVAPLALVGLWLRDRRAVLVVAWLTMALSMTFDGSGNNRLYNLPWLLLVGIVMWWLVRTCLASADGHRLGAAHDLPGQVAVEGVNGTARQ
ncbi:alpha-(1-_6)-mannopyranosyltransferase A [Corynebacterium terpenotabidum]|uniref:Alpha-(1->6)-mannopyranosyltransferase A n=1 Tax=Corynebacterium terpenotabidum Y-11 TaxID=1200352 RepID=S4XDG5_9CORY|nr:alpha-(1->6)-mannopyranosyltransferase A [Corynebacterium terpenotabidum]AGP30569.1 alpha 1,6 mannopyranosyltransferase [Corynebacterium terpenotabidum Y-11]